MRGIGLGLATHAFLRSFKIVLQGITTTANWPFYTAPSFWTYLGSLPRRWRGAVMYEAVLTKLQRRLGRLHAKLRLGIEMDHEAQIFG